MKIKTSELTGAAVTSLRCLMTYSEQQLFAAANILKSNSGENPEYDRALVEMIALLTGADEDDVASKLG